jgi:hypothetical protein
VPIQYGARFSGKLNKDWRIGAMNMQTDKVEETSLPAQNFSVVALQRRVFARSNIGAIFINKESLHYSDTENFPYSRYNRNMGLEYNLASSNNQWTGKVLFLKSFSPGKQNRDISHAANLQYSSRDWTLSWQHEYVGANYNAEVGYVPRTGYVKLNPSVTRLFFPEGTKILSHGPKIDSKVFFNESFGQTDYENTFLYQFNFRSQSVLDLWVGEIYIKLLQPFDPTNSGLDSLTTGTRHRWKTWGIDYISKPQSLFTYAASLYRGGYYSNGTLLSVSGEAGYRFQPYVSFLLSANYNDINLPEPWGRKQFLLIGPRLDVTMTNKLFFTAFAQYNKQQKNVNLNTHLQWRYRPASDLYIVYTDNYLPETFGVKNRAVVIKLTYWWNI